MPGPIYLDHADYTRTIAAVAECLPPCPWTGGADLEAAKIHLVVPA